MHALENGSVSPAVRQALLKDDKFMQAVGGLRVPGTRQMVSEENANNAVFAAMNVLGNQIAAAEPVADKKGLTMELVKVLALLQLNVTPKYDESLDNKLFVQLTPTTQLTNGLVIRSRQLNHLGISLSVPEPEKPMKLKTSDSAA
jgi:hypothetical protein